MRYFAEVGDEDARVYPLSYFKKRIIEEGIKELRLIEYKRDKFHEVPMWCAENEDYVEPGDCGILCNRYRWQECPCSRCRYLKNGFVRVGGILILANGKLKEER